MRSATMVAGRMISAWSTGSLGLIPTIPMPFAWASVKRHLKVPTRR